jgi:hypothetical protein
MLITSNRFFFQIKLLFLFLISVFLSEHAITQESITNQLYKNGYYTSSIQSLKTELKSLKLNRKRVEIYYYIANSYYGMSFVEDYKKHIDSAYQLAQKLKDFSYLDKVEYGIAKMRYYNFEIKPEKSLEIYATIYPLFHKHDPNRNSVLWISLFQNIANTRRNTGADYNLMNQEYDTTYLLLIKHNLLNTIHEVNYCKARGNMNLDRVHLTSSPIYYDQTIKFYEKGLAILSEKGNQNYPMEIAFHCLEGLVSYMGGKINLSKVYYDKAYVDIEISKTKMYQPNDSKSIYLNVCNWSTFTMSLVYLKYKDIALIKEHLVRLKKSIKLYQSYSQKNKDVDISVFTDIYGYSPYNSIVTCYYYLYKKTNNNVYIDSAFYYGEMNKSQWNVFNRSFTQLKKAKNEFVKNGNIIVQYGEFGFYHHTYLYAIVFSKKGSYFMKLGKESEINSLKFDFMNWKYNDFREKSNKLYAIVFKPLEKCFHEKPTKIIINKSRLIVGFSLESLITDTRKTLREQPFLFFKYPIYNQPSFRSYFIKTSFEPLDKACLITPNYVGKNKAQIRFSGNVLKDFVNKSEMNVVSFKSRKHDLLLIAAHCSPGNHRVDNTYIDLGEKSLSIKDVCQMKLNSKLAVLAFCDGGIGQNISGSSFSMASSFLMSGVESCLYSIWKLDDKIGSEVIASFLERVKKGEQKDVALRAAKKEYLENVTSEEGYNPIYWAGLNVMGNVAPIEIHQSEISWWKIGSVILLFFLLGYGIKKFLQ